jgi:hypothetical protein
VTRHHNTHNQKKNAASPFNLETPAILVASRAPLSSAPSALPASAAAAIGQKRTLGSFPMTLKRGLAL